MPHIIRIVAVYASNAVGAILTRKYSKNYQNSLTVQRRAINCNLFQVNTLKLNDK